MAVKNVFLFCFLKAFVSDFISAFELFIKASCVEINNLKSLIVVSNEVLRVWRFSICIFLKASSLLSALPCSTFFKAIFSCEFGMQVTSFVEVCERPSKAIRIIIINTVDFFISYSMDIINLVVCDAIEICKFFFKKAVS